MQIKIKRFDKDLPLPQYKSQGAVCVDLCSRLDTIIPAFSTAYIPLNIAMEIPKGYFGLMAPRSSTHKAGLICLNHVGFVDNDFCGDNDEFVFAAYNFTKTEVKIEKGQRIAQFMIVKFNRITFTEVEKLASINRGGFGSTGQK